MVKIEINKYIRGANIKGRIGRKNRRSLQANEKKNKYIINIRGTKKLMEKMNFFLSFLFSIL